MDSVVVVVLVGLGVAMLIGGIMAFFAYRKAPNGFEDDQGFHSWEERER